MALGYSQNRHQDDSRHRLPDHREDSFRPAAGDRRGHRPAAGRDGSFHPRHREASSADSAHRHRDLLCPPAASSPCPDGPFPSQASAAVATGAAQPHSRGKAATCSAFHPRWAAASVVAAASADLPASVAAAASADVPASVGVPASAAAGPARLGGPSPRPGDHRRRRHHAGHRGHAAHRDQQREQPSRPSCRQIQATGAFETTFRANRERKRVGEACVKHLSALPSTEIPRTLSSPETSSETQSRNQFRNPGQETSPETQARKPDLKTFATQPEAAYGLPPDCVPGATSGCGGLRAIVSSNAGSSPPATIRSALRTVKWS